MHYSRNAEINKDLNLARAGWIDDDYYEDMFESTMDLLIKRSDHYLVFAHNCKWDGSSGYKLTDSIADAVTRSYEVEITPLGASPGGKTLVCREASHDAPMGATTTIIALTEREYDKFNNASFEEIESFVNWQEKIAMRHAK